MYISLSLSSVTTFRSPVCPDIFTELTAKCRWRLIIMFCETLHKNNYENRKHILRSYAHCWWRHWHLRMLILHILIDRWMLLHVSATIYSCIQGALLYTKRLKLSIDEICSNSYLGMAQVQFVDNKLIYAISRLIIAQWRLPVWIKARDAVEWRVNIDRTVTRKHQADVWICTRVSQYWDWIQLGQKCNKLEFYWFTNLIEIHLKHFHSCCSSVRYMSSTSDRRQIRLLSCGVYWHDCETCQGDGSTVTACEVQKTCRYCWSLTGGSPEFVFKN
jgi:hypothetical protein